MAQGLVYDRAPGHDASPWHSIAVDRAQGRTISLGRLVSALCETSQVLSTLWPVSNMGVLEKIKEIEAEMARTQKNKATEYVRFF